MLEDQIALFDSTVPINVLIHFSGYFRDAFKVVTGTSEESVVTKFGPDEHGRETLFAPAQVVQAPGGLISITIMGGDALSAKAFKIVLRWMIDTCKSGEIKDIPDKLSVTDLIHCMGVLELLAVPTSLKDQMYCLLTNNVDDQVPLDDVKALYAHATVGHPARSIVVESIGKAFLEKRLKNENAYCGYSDENEEFKKDLQQYISKTQAAGDVWTTESFATAQAPTVAGAPLVVDEPNTLNGKPENHGSKLTWGLASKSTASFAPSCGNEAFNHFAPTHLPKKIISFDGPADEWSTVGNASVDTWNTGAAGWQDTPAPAGSLEDTWASTGDGSNNNNGWGDDTGGAGDAKVDDDNTCRRCKKPGHFARECPQPRDDSCFNCGQPGHMSRECTEPKRARGDDRTCRKCNEAGHIARDCPTSGGGGGDRACHKCGETGHIQRDCPSSAFGTVAGGGGSGMKCYNCQQYGHKSSECTNEPVEREYGSDPRTCNKCGEKGHISRDCRGDGGDFNSVQHDGGGYGEQYNTGYGDGSGGGGGYDGQDGLYDPAAGPEESSEPPREEIINVTVKATRVRKGKKGRPGYLDITQQLYDPRAFEEPEPTPSYGAGGERRGGRGGRRGGGGGGHRRDAGDDRSHGGDFGNENVPPPAPEAVPTVVVEGDWADDAGDGSFPVASRW